MKIRNLLILAFLSAVTGCAATVIPREFSDHLDPRPVFLLDHGLHTSLALSRDDGTLVRYVYGDWRWYAMRETGFFRAFPTLFTKTQAALGRRELPGPAEADAIRRQLRVEVKHIYTFSAPAERIDYLIKDIDARFYSARDTLIYNRGYDLEFVHDPRPYHFGYNSNHAVAEWIQALDLEVHGNPAIGRWRITHSSQ